jgi:hypothetical protein
MYDGLPQALTALETPMIAASSSSITDSLRSTSSTMRCCSPTGGSGSTIDLISLVFSRGRPTPRHYTPSGPRVIRLQNVGDGVFVDERAHISRAHFERLSKHHIFAGDLVIAALGDNQPRLRVIPAAIGEAAVKADCI